MAAGKRLSACLIDRGRDGRFGALLGKKAGAGVELIGKLCGNENDSNYREKKFEQILPPSMFIAFHTNKNWPV